MIDYHIHTLLCNHAEGGMESCIQRAVEMGLEEICFLEHLSFDPAIRSHAMDIHEVPFYFFSLQKKKKKYEEKISILAGLEIDFSQPFASAIEELTHLFDFDLIAGSVHFVDGINIASRRHAAQIDDKTFEKLSVRYASDILALVQSELFDVACHLDVITKNGRSLPSEAKALLKEAISNMGQTGMALEVNAGGLHHPIAACYPCTELIDHALACKTPLTTGSDAHRPMHVGRGIPQVLDLIQSLGGTQITRFKKRKGRPMVIQQAPGVQTP